MVYCMFCKRFDDCTNEYITDNGDCIDYIEDTICIKKLMNIRGIINDS